MPELPEVETVKNGMAPHMVGRVIAKVDVRREGLRVPFPAGLAKKLQKATVERLTRRAKYILVHLSTRQVMVLHLGMSGRISIQQDMATYKPVKHDHLIIHMTGGGGVVFNDPRRFGLVYLLDEGEVALHPSFKDMGPEPLSNEFSGPVLHERLKGKKTPVKVALMDQRVVVGVGNIYASEALHQAGINPSRPAADLSKAMAEKLVIAVCDVLTQAIAAGGSTLKDYRQSDGSLGYFQHGFSVYGKEGEPCPTCRGGGKREALLQKTVHGGRATYFCPRCQK